jgi:hypothetical protein
MHLSWYVNILVYYRAKTKWYITATLRSVGELVYVYIIMYTYSFLYLHHYIHSKKSTCPSPFDSTYNETKQKMFVGTDDLA